MLSVWVEESVFVFLVLQVLVVGDFRVIVSVIQMVVDIDWMGVLVLYVVKIVCCWYLQYVLFEEVNGYFVEMGRVVVELGNSV